jgi:prepilin-type N-terminal cleavage/methylation domain-containing protein
MRSRLEPSRGGFTLLEIMLAVVILGIILLTVYGSLSRTISSKSFAEDQAELYSTGREAVLRIAGDVETAMPPRFGDRIFFRGTGGAGQVPELQFVAMNRGGYGLDRVRAGRVLIVYTLDPVPNRRGIFALRREEHLFAALLAQADGIELPTPDENDDRPQAPDAVANYVLDCASVPDEIDLPGNCTQLVGLSFRYYDDATREWRDEWDTTEEQSITENRLPAAVEIRLTLADEHGVDHDFTTIVDLPLARGQPTPNPDGSLGEDGEADDADTDTTGTASGLNLPGRGR